MRGSCGAIRRSLSVVAFGRGRSCADKDEDEEETGSGRVRHGCGVLSGQADESIEPQAVSDFRNPWEEWEIWAILMRKSVLGGMGVIDDLGTVGNMGRMERFFNFAQGLWQDLRRRSEEEEDGAGRGLKAKPRRREKHNVLRGSRVAMAIPMPIPILVFRVVLVGGLFFRVEVREISFGNRYGRAGIYRSAVLRQTEQSSRCRRDGHRER